MNSDLKDKNPFKSKNVIHSFRYAFRGIYTALIAERNMKIHFMFGIVVILISIYVGLSVVEWLFILSAIGGVIVLELINSALERIVDISTNDYHPLAKEAKDMAAGAVLIFSIYSVIVGIVIFLPKFF